MKTLSWRTLPLLAAVAVAFALSTTGLLPEARGDGGKKLSQREMKKKMNGWAREIGVKCDYCHVKHGDEYDYEAKTPMKAIGHYCEENFVEKLASMAAKKQVSCVDCHNRKPKFLPRPDGAGGAGAPGGAPGGDGKMAGGGDDDDDDRKSGKDDDD